MRFTAALLICLLLPVVLTADITDPTKSPPAEKGTDFIRFIEEDTADSLQTGIASYLSPEGVVIDLVGAVHIADKAYFNELNARFRTYDTVLYELVGRPVEQREELKVADGEKRLQWLGQLQETMRKTLELESQLQCIDYKAANFVHADMSTEGFLNTQKDKQENFLMLWMKAAVAQAATSDNRKTEPGLVELLAILSREDSATEMKRLVGQQFDSVEQLMAGIESGNGTVIIGERNRHALEVLQKQITDGKKHLAIFYGAAHLPDMEQRLLKKGYKLKNLDWIKAWNLPHDE